MACNKKLKKQKYKRNGNKLNQSSGVWIAQEWLEQRIETLKLNQDISFKLLKQVQNCKMMGETTINKKSLTVCLDSDVWHFSPPCSISCWQG